jgi:PhnB protein
MAVKPVPADYPVVTPMLVCRNAAAVIHFAKTAFGARERMRMPGPDGSVMHAELEIGKGGVVMLGDANGMVASKPPSGDGSSPVVIHVYVQNVDDAFKKAEAAGAKVLIPPKDQFYGDRSGRLMDPNGHVWVISTHIEDVSPEEMERRMAAQKPQ